MELLGLKKPNLHRPLLGTIVSESLINYLNVMVSMADQQNSKQKQQNKRNSALTLAPVLIPMVAPMLIYVKMDSFQRFFV